jgi:molecular chaperone GrpE (heat shock protein)
MSEPNSLSPSLNKLPFWFADAMLLAAAGTLVAVGARPLRVWEMLAIVVCVGLGGWLAVLPFLKEYELASRFAETNRLANTTAKLTQLDEIADRIAHATSQWQSVQDRAGKTAELAGGIVDRLAREAESFAGAVSRTADGEKQTLKLEVEKLRRAETEWLQAVGRVMDHIHALHLAALRSGQPNLVAQMERFHTACRDALRRVGFAAIAAGPDEVFDPRKHQTADGSRPAEGARVEETVAPGYVYQGHLLRPVIVKVAEPGTGAEATPAAAPEGGETESISVSSEPPASLRSGGASGTEPEPAGEAGLGAS